MPRTKGGVQQAIAEQDPDEEDEYAFEVGRRVRVWWPPTDAEDRTGYAGMYWPVKILEVNGNRVSVEYDNGEDEEVALEHLQPANPPVDFGKEAVHLQVSLTDSMTRYKFACAAIAVACAGRLCLAVEFHSALADPRGAA
jgi:hypothetical protein